VLKSGRLRSVGSNPATGANFKTQKQMRTEGFVIELEDNGQDFLKFTTDSLGTIIKTEPFQGEVWNGGFIPVDFQLEGELCAMHKPPHISYGYLKHKVVKITELKSNESN